MVNLFPITRSHLRDILIVVCLFLAQTNSTWFLIGWPGIIIGLVFRIWTKGILRRNKTLTIDGPYVFCRHPFYLANLILDISLCLIAGAPWLILVYVPLFLLVYLPTIRREEKFLLRHFGEQAEAFRNKTSLFLPRIPRSISALRAPWSLNVILREREVSRTLRLLAVPLLILWVSELRQGWWEALEGESFLLLFTALFLHFSGRFIYLKFERAGSLGQIRLAQFAGIACMLLVLFFCVVEARLLGYDELHQRAREMGAIAVETEGEFLQRVNSPTKNMLIVSDDTLENQSSTPWKYTVERVVWSDFEVFFLINPIGFRNSQA